MEKTKAVFVIFDYFVQTHFDIDMTFGKIAQIETTEGFTFSLDEMMMFRDLMFRIKTETK